MKEFQLTIVAMAAVSVDTTVRALDEEDARRRGLEHALSGNAVWAYGGVDYETVGVLEVTEIVPRREQSPSRVRWLLLIETKHPEDYDGPRVTIFRSRSDALADAAAWLGMHPTPGLEMLLHGGEIEAALILAVEANIIHGWKLQAIEI